MDAIQITASDSNKYLSGNDIYTKYKPYWQYLFESYVGGEEYRNAGNLAHYVNETSSDYMVRLQNTPLHNHCNSVISVYNSFLFRLPPKRSYGSLENLPELQDFLNDCDMDGRNFNSFMKDVATISSIFGHAWILVTKPNTGAITRMDEMLNGVRPYVNLLSPLTVLDWSWSRQSNGRYTLDKFKYIEDINGEIVTLKEWTPTEIYTTVIDESAGVVINRELEPNGLGKIPAVIAYNKRSIIRGIGISDIADIADAQRFIYNAVNEIDQSIRLDSHPSLVKTPETNAGVGAGSIIHMPENLDPGLKPYVLDYTGASIDKILASIEATVEAIDKMANTGAVRATTARSMSGVAIDTEFQLLNARLSEKGDALELAEENIWRLFAEYMNLEWDGVVEYPESFNLRDKATDLELYLKASTVSVNSETYRKELQKQIAKTIIDDEMVMEAIETEIASADMNFVPHVMVNPETGESRIATNEQQHLDLSAQGWIHPEMEMEDDSEDESNNEGV